MRVANTVELKNKTNELLRYTMGGEPVIITLRGKPAAALTPLSGKAAGPMRTPMPMKPTRTPSMRLAVSRSSANMTCARSVTMSGLEAWIMAADAAVIWVSA